MTTMVIAIGVALTIASGLAEETRITPVVSVSHRTHGPRNCLPTDLSYPPHRADR
jgi:hypothetical protein